MANGAKELNVYLLDQLSGLDGVFSRPMMGGYLFYYRDKIVGGIYGPGFMVKLTPSSRRLLPTAEQLPPYEGAGDMLLVDAIDQPEPLCELLRTMWDELPAPAPRKPRRKG